MIIIYTEMKPELTSN